MPFFSHPAPNGISTPYAVTLDPTPTAPVDTTHLPRPALIEPRFAVKPPAQDVFPNLLGTTLAPVPIGKQVFDTPARVVNAAAQFDPPNLLETTLAPVAAVALPPGRAVFDAAVAPKLPAQFTAQGVALLPTPIIPQPPGAQLFADATRPAKLPAQLDPANLLGTTLQPVVAVALPPGQAVFYGILAPRLPAQFTAPGAALLPPPIIALPPGAQLLQDRPAAAKSAAQFDPPNLLPAQLGTIPPGQAILLGPALTQRIAAQFDPPNLLGTTLAPPGAPVFGRVFESLPLAKPAWQYAFPNTLGTLLAPPIITPLPPGMALLADPARRQQIASQFTPPNTTPFFPPPPAPPASGGGSTIIFGRNSGIF